MSEEAAGGREVDSWHHLYHMHCMYILQYMVIAGCTVLYKTHQFTMTHEPVGTYVSYAVYICVGTVSEALFLDVSTVCYAPQTGV